MGKTGKWLKNFLTGKKEKDKDKVIHHEPVPSPNKTESGSVPGPSPKEKKRWSFRRSKELYTGDVNSNIPNNNNGISEDDIEKTKQVMAVAVAATLTADKIEAEAEEEAAEKITSETHGRKKSMYVEDEAAVKIQANYRAYLARKALCALRGLVKLQALIRGHLVRMQATETLRRMQALVAAQERAGVQRIQMVEEVQSISYRTPNHRTSPQHPRFQELYEMENYAEENIKTVEMDIAEPRSKTKGRNSYSTPLSYSTPQSEGLEHRHSMYYYGSRTPSKCDIHYNYSPCPSALTDISPIGHSGRFEEFSFKTAQNSPQYHPAVSNGSTDYPFFPNYMSNTESSRAKARSQSAPRQRHESYERQSSRRKHPIEGRNIPRGVKMQRSSSQVGLPIIGHQFPWHLKLHRPSVSARDSECGSNSSVLTNNNYCRSLATYELYGNKY